ncbi:hypothetical protein ZEAMMB73_Zm00001d044739 [Zea mays]|uniref:NET domain-containing protein n=1 Tax=Zea mays TaxID=4577 RepID=A0A1D6NR09_MAIZE|nr:hypothetical protein ZEAMMB73_Zm00001d044739 [Zea mays]
MQDESWSAITGSCTIVRDMKDMLVHSYYEVRLHAPPDGKRKMAADKKRNLGAGLYHLSPDDLNKVLEIVAQDNRSFQPKAKEVDLNMDAQDLFKARFGQTLESQKLNIKKIETQLCRRSTDIRSASLHGRASSAAADVWARPWPAPRVSRLATATSIDVPAEDPVGSSLSSGWIRIFNERSTDIRSASLHGRASSAAADVWARPWPAPRISRLATATSIDVPVEDPAGSSLSSRWIRIFNDRSTDIRSASLHGRASSAATDVWARPWPAPRVSRLATATSIEVPVEDPASSSLSSAADVWARPWPDPRVSQLATATSIDVPVEDPAGSSLSSGRRIPDPPCRRSLPPPRWCPSSDVELLDTAVPELLRAAATDVLHGARAEGLRADAPPPAKLLLTTGAEGDSALLLLLPAKLLRAAAAELVRVVAVECLRVTASPGTRVATAAGSTSRSEHMEPDWMAAEI